MHRSQWPATGTGLLSSLCRAYAERSKPLPTAEFGLTRLLSTALFEYQGGEDAFILNLKQGDEITVALRLNNRSLQLRQEKVYGLALGRSLPRLRNCANPQSLLNKSAIASVLPMRIKTVGVKKLDLVERTW
jgi:hypothetical protein